MVVLIVDGGWVARDGCYLDIFPITQTALTAKKKFYSILIMINDISESEGMNLPKAKFQFGQKVKVNWHEADVETSEAWIVGVNYNPYLSGNIHYAALVEPGDYIITDVNEDMLETIEE